MIENSLHTFTQQLHASWGPLSSELVASARQGMEQLVEAQLVEAQLVEAQPSEAWLAALYADAPDSRELFRDPKHDFLLLAHTEQAGLYRPPHDHGRGWVIYAVVRGELQMSTYRRIHDLRGNARLVARETFTLRAGDIRVFLPGDIHDTRCVAAPLTLLRLTSRDFKHEEVTRYPEPGAVTCPAPSPEAP